jgi:hypothetical protein
MLADALSMMPAAASKKTLFVSAQDRPDAMEGGRSNVGLIRRA